jgi:hypothetical protein
MNRSGQDPNGEAAEYLARAKQIAHEAIDKLWHSGAKLFRDHPKSDFYQNSGGVANLLYALLELEEATDGDSEGENKSSPKKSMRCLNKR